MIALRTPRRKDAMRESLTDRLRRAAHPLSTDRDLDPLLDRIGDARGGPASWIVRDTHMAETLERLLAHHGPEARAVVWEHSTDAFIHLERISALDPLYMPACVDGEVPDTYRPGSTVGTGAGEKRFRPAACAGAAPSAPWEIGSFTDGAGA